MWWMAAFILLELSWCSMVGLMETSSKRAYSIPESAAPRAPAPAAVHCWPVPPQERLKHSSVSVSVRSLGPGAHKVCLSPLSVSGGSGFDFKLKFAPSTILLGRLFCLWTWCVSSKSLQLCAAAAPAPTVLPGLLLWMWGISSQLLQCHAARARHPGMWSQVGLRKPQYEQS